MDACAGSLLRYRKQIGATDILVMTDIKKKHASHQITADYTIEDEAKGAEFCGSNAIILSGKETGSEADVKELLRLKNVTNLPVFIGSGVTESNVKNYELADGLIVGSFFKQDGLWENPIDPKAVQKFMTIHREMTPRV
jgi:predicted TIM-barrel enzyme